ncbi:MAG: IclR family transcriptional regulator [Alphaproteobacteria bacterium]|jgi:DNA-binding IclR family transcriptional regulator|nr:IclR family transcriptional regulator [Alphaproteobacteria bacterium]MDP6622207.1 IclR family transcriptional regulator [Alphaproteobacteria bacterium]
MDATNRKGTAARTSKTKPVAAVERALRVLNVFRHTRSPLWLHEISDATGLFKSTILRLLDTLQLHGYIVRLADGRYQLGAVIFELGSAYQATFQLEHLVQPILEQLSDVTGESATFYVREGDMRQCMWRVESPQSVRDVLRPGQLLTIGGTATGQVFRDFDSGKAIKISKNLKKMVRESSKIEDDQTASISIPIFGARGFVGALSVAGPTGRFTRSSVARMKGNLAEAAAKLYQQLGHEL